MPSVSSWRAHMWVPIWIVCIFLGRGLASNSLEYDEAEQILHAQFLGWGYQSQPPVFEWLLYAWSRLWGGAGLWSLLSLKALLLMVVYVAVYQTFKLLCQSTRLAQSMALSVFVLSQMNWEIPRTLTHTLVATASLAMVMWLFTRLLVQAALVKKPWAYFSLGVMLAVAMLSKYNSVVVLGLAFLTLLTLPSTRQVLWRRYLQDPKWWWATALLVVALLTPHVWWLSENWGVATEPILTKLISSEPQGFWFEKAQGFWGLLMGMLSFVATLLLVPWLAYRGERQKTHTPTADSVAKVWPQVVKFAGVYLLYFGVFCASLILVFGTNGFKVRWFTPFLFWIPPVMIGWMYLQGGSLALFEKIAKGLLWVAGVLFVLRAPIVGWLGQPSWLNMPAQKLSQDLNRDFPVDAPLLTPDIRLAGSIRLHSPERAVMYPAYPVFSRHQNAMACRVLLVQGDFENSPPNPGVGSSDMLATVASHWKLSVEEVREWALQHQTHERSYILPGHYSKVLFHVRALMLERPGGCEEKTKS